MKITKKIFNVVLIFMIIQAIGIILIGNKAYAGDDGFFDKAFSNGKKWKEMGGSNSEAIIQNANGVFDVTEEIYVGIRTFGIIVLAGTVVFTGITISMKNNGKDVAGAKTTIAVLAILGVLLLTSENIMNTLTKFFEDLESLI